jgi:glycosyltransferase involved in cell wall biosynthesis
MSVRTTQKRVARRVLVHGLVYFGKIFADFMNGDGWEFRYYPDTGVRNLTQILGELPSCDLIYQLGGRITQGKFLRVARALGKKRIVMHWLGSDVLDDKAEALAGNRDAWVLSRLHHWVQSDWMLREVNALGVPCELMPFPSALVPEKPSPLPEKFSVLVYVPTLQRSDLYGLDRILRVARELPDISFELVGLLDGPVPNAPKNLRVHGRIPNLVEFYRRCSVVWRPTRHDGVSWMVLESLGHGRHVLWTYPFPGCIQVDDASDARDQILRLYGLHSLGLLQMNEEGARFTSRGDYNPRLLRTTIHSRLEQILES